VLKLDEDDEEEEEGGNAGNGKSVDAGGDLDEEEGGKTAYKIPATPKKVLYV
jgi:hypothetical protein